jgi:protein ImuB
MAPIRVLVAEVDGWPTIAAGCPPDQAAAVVSANRVQAVTPAARAEGVRPGIRRREAQGRCPGLEVLLADPGRDARAWEPVVAAVESSLTPSVEVMRSGAIGFATRGPSRYFGGDLALADKVAATVDGVVGHPCCRVGVADGRFAAGLAALRAGLSDGSGPLVVPPGGSRAWLAPLPVSALGGEYEALSDLLVRLGVTTLGELANLPSPSVLGRFGAAGAVAHRLAQGRDASSVTARTPPAELVVEAELDPPEQRVEAAAFVAKALADELQDRLGRAGLACTKVAIEVETEHGESLVRHWRHEGELSASGLAERTRWQLDGWLTHGSGGRPTGGLTLLRLTPEEVRPDTGRQLGFWGGVADVDTRAARALARTQGLLGPDAVVTAVVGGGRGLSEQIRLVPWGDCRDEPGRRQVPRRVMRGPSEQPPPWPGRLSRPSPAVVYRYPLSAELSDRQGRPVEVNGRGVISAPPAALAIEGLPSAQVMAWAGPWPLEERWWEAGGRRRARLQLILAGGEAYLVSRESGRWWVEATYD